MRATIPTAVVGLGELGSSAEAGAPDDGANAGTPRPHVARIPRQPGRRPTHAGPESSATASANLFASIHNELPRLQSSLGTIKVPFGFLAGALSHLPVAASTK